MSELPLAEATLKALLAESSSSSPSSSPGASFRVGPGVLRAPPPVHKTAPPKAQRSADDDDAGHKDTDKDTGDLLGELVDMVLVGADDADSGQPEVHLKFKADVFGGLHLRLIRQRDGLVAHFVVGDAAARRAVVDHVNELVAHLKARGFSIVAHDLVVA